MKKLILTIVILIALATPCLAADLTITGLTDAQIAALTGQNMTQYVADFANHLIFKKATDEKYQLIKVLTAKTDTELKAAAAPILAAEKAKADAESVIPK